MKQNLPCASEKETRTRTEAQLCRTVHVVCIFNKPHAWSVAVVAAILYCTLAPAYFYLLIIDQLMARVFISA